MKTGFVKSDQITNREIDELVSSLEAMGGMTQLLNDADKCVMEFEQVLNNLLSARNTIATYSLSDVVISSLDGKDKSFTLAMESHGITFNGVTDYSSLQDQVLNAIDANIEEACEGFWDAIKSFVKKIMDWIVGLFSMNQRMQNLFEKASKLYDAKMIDAKEFESIKIANGLDTKNFNAIGSIVVKFDNMISPLLTKFCTITSVLNVKQVMSDDAESEKQRQLVIPLIDKVGRSIMELSNSGPAGLITIDKGIGGRTDEDIMKRLGAFSFDYSVITQSDKTCKELGFNPVILDACIDNAKNVLVNVNRYGVSLQKSSKIIHNIYRDTSFNQPLMSESRRVLSMVAHAFRAFTNGCRFVTAGSQIMSRQVYTMLKQAKVTEESRFKNAKQVDKETPNTFGQLLLQ